MQTTNWWLETLMIEKIAPWFHFKNMATYNIIVSTAFKRKIRSSKEQNLLNRKYKACYAYVLWFAFTLQIASRFPVPTMHGWCEQNKTRTNELGPAARAADDIRMKALTKTSTDGRKGTWGSNEFSGSLKT